MGKYDKQISAGCTFLDEHVPGWVDRINLDLLDLGECTICVVGQLIGRSEENDGLHDLLPDVPFDEPWPVEFGFSLGFDDGCDGIAGTYPGLTRAWKRAIRARRAVAAPAPGSVAGEAM